MIYELIVAKVFRARDKDKMPSKSETPMPLAIHNEGEHPLKLVKSYIEWIERNRVYNKLYRINCFKIEKQYK